MTKGYGGQCRIGGHACLLSSYSLSMGTNMMASAAVGPIWDNAGGHFARLRMPAVRDCPTHEIGLGLQATGEVLDYLLDELCDNSFHEPVRVAFSDDTNGLSYDFGDAYVSSFSLSVQNNFAADVTLSLQHFRESFSAEWDGHSLRKNGGFGSSLAGPSLIPYWMFGLEMDGVGMDEDDVQSFSLTFAQGVTPKFECAGGSDPIAPAPPVVIFGQAGISYEVTYLMYHEGGKYLYGLDSRTAFKQTGDIAVKWHRSPSDTERYSMSDGYGSTGAKLLPGNSARTLTLIMCHPETFSPQVGSPDSPNSMTVSGAVYGRPKFSKGS